LETPEFQDKFHFYFHLLFDDSAIFELVNDTDSDQHEDGEQAGAAQSLDYGLDDLSR